MFRRPHSCSTWLQAPEPKRSARVDGARSETRLAQTHQQSKLSAKPLCTRQRSTHLPSSAGFMFKRSVVLTGSITSACFHAIEFCRASRKDNQPPRDHQRRLTTEQARNGSCKPKAPIQATPTTLILLRSMPALKHSAAYRVRQLQQLLRRERRELVSQRQLLFVVGMTLLLTAGR